MAAPSGFTQLVASHIQDAGGNGLSGTLDVLPTDAADLPVNAVAGGIGGPVLKLGAFAFTGGVLAANSWVPDSALTTNAHTSYRFTFLDASGATLAVWKGVQPTGATFNLDSYQPNVAPQAIIQPGPVGPQGPSGVVSGTQMATAITRDLTGNVFNPSTVTMDAVLSTSGAIIAIVNDPRFFVSDWITVKPGGWLVCNLHMPSSAAGYPPLGGCFYDVNDAFLSGFSGVTAGTGIAVPANAVSARFCSDAGNGDGSGIWSCKVYLSQTLPSAAADPTLAAAAIATSLPINLFDPSAVTSSNLLVAGSGALYAFSDGNYVTSDFFPLRAGGTVSCNFPVYGVASGYPPFGWAFYDGNKNYVGGVVGGAARTPVAVPATAVYGRACFDQRSVTLALVVIMRDVTIPAYYVYPGMTAAASLDIASTVTGPAAGKRWLHFGDSISAIYGGGWLPTVAAKTGMIQVGQDAQTGRTVGGIFSMFTGAGGTYDPSASSGVSNVWSDGVSRWAWDSTKTLAQNVLAIAPDVITIELGTNDGLTSVGTLADTTTAATLAGYSKHAIETLLGIVPAARLLWIGPYRAYNPDPYPNQAAMLQAVCAHYAVPYLDQYNTSGINDLTRSSYLLSDGVHPGALANTMLGRRVSAFINQQF